MKICRVRNFKKSVEVTVSFTADDCENLSHIISTLPDSYPVFGYPEKKLSGRKVLVELDNQIFWTHWKSNFEAKEFEPVGDMK